MRHITVIAITMAFSVVSLAACTDAARDKALNYANPSHVRCYSGGVEIYNGASTGRVLETTDSDGWSFRDSKSGELVQVYGDCVITLIE